MKYIYELEFDVRDYECDLQGIVNNANYQHYYEHTRHQFLRQNNISFADMHDQGIDFVVARVTLSYKVPLRSKDRFKSVLALEKHGLKYTFFQKIYRLPDLKLCHMGTTDCVCVDHGKLADSQMLTDFVSQLN